MPERAGYLRLLRSNVAFRRLWAGNVVSLFGDSFNTLALYRVVEDLTGSPFALGAVFLTKLLPLALASPLAAALVDRLDRGRVLIATDLVRAVLVLGLLAIDTRAELPWLYVLVATQVAVSAAFGPAENALIPNVVRPSELLAANALMAGTWSAVFAVGMLAGGPAVEYFGADAVFAFDSATYLLSAWFIARARLPRLRPEAAVGPAWRVAVREVAEGARYVAGRAGVRRIIGAKAAWALGGGAATYLLVLLGGVLLPEAPSVGVSVLYAARGLGTGVGPVVARALFHDAARWPTVLGACVALSGAGYLAVGALPWTLGVAALVCFAHAASGANWVLSTTLLQQRSEDRLRGRVFAADWLLVTLVESASILAASLLVEGGLSLRAAILAFAAVQVATGLLWLLTVAPAERRALPVASAPAPAPGTPR